MNLGSFLEHLGGLVVHFGGWLIDNPDLASALIAGIVYIVGENIRKRPPPDPPTGWKMALWQMRERVTVMPWDKTFGKLKLPFRIEPMLKVMRQGSSPDTTTLQMAPRVAGLTTPPPAAGRRPPTRDDDTLPAATLSALAGARDITETLPLPSSRRLPAAPPFPPDPPAR